MKTKKAMIVERIKSGMKPSEIAKEVGCHVIYVYQVANRLGIKYPKNKLPSGLREKAKELYMKGWNKAKISREIGASVITIRKWLNADNNKGRENTECENKA